MEIDIAARSSRGRGFSLVELLTVMGILSLLMVGVASIAKGPSDAQKLRAAGDLVSDMATLSRQHSLSRNTHTALVILNGNAPEDQALRTLALFELRQPGAGAVGGEWRQLTPWRQLPPGVAIQGSVAGSTFFTPSGAVPGAPLPAQLTVGGRTTADYGYQIFQPNGRLLHPETVTLKVAPAVSASADPRNYMVVSIIASTGQAKVFQP